MCAWYEVEGDLRRQPPSFHQAAQPNPPGHGPRISRCTCRRR